MDFGRGRLDCGLQAGRLETKINNNPNNITLYFIVKYYNENRRKQLCINNERVFL